MRKYLIAALVGLAVLAITAFAASLGVNAGTLQAGQGTIEKCVADDIAVSYDEPTLEGGVWLVDGLTLTPAPTDDCNGLSFTVVVTGNNNLETTPKSGVFASGTGSVTYTGSERFDADEATDVHVAIRNTPPAP
jgi:hypothetical protein